MDVGCWMLRHFRQELSGEGTTHVGGTFRDEQYKTSPPAIVLLYLSVLRNLFFFSRLY
jgi:hypothetical protein